MSDDPPANPGVQAAFRDVQMAVAGHAVPDAIKAMLEAISLLIGMAAHDQEAALIVADSLPVMLRAAVIGNWDHARTLRQQSLAHTGQITTHLQ